MRRIIVLGLTSLLLACGPDPLDSADMRPAELTASPSAAPVQTLATDTAVFNFESGTQGWQAKDASSLLVSSSTRRFYSGERSLLASVRAGTAMQVEVGVGGVSVPPGSTVSFRVWFPRKAAIESFQVFAQEGSATGWRWNGNWMDVASLRPSAWNEITVRLPADATPKVNLGVQITTASAWSGSVFIDSVTWAGGSTPPPPPPPPPPPDAGTGTPDAGSSTPDAGTGTPDAGTGTPDAGTGTPDAGSGGGSGTACGRIMPLGDSITEGVNGGYRNGVYDGLRADGCAVDMVGSVYDQYTRVADKHHEGHPGFTIGNLADSIDGWLASAQPTHVLLMAGTNDIAWWTTATGAQVADTQAALVDRILAQRPGVWVIVGSIPPITSQIIQPNNVDRAQLQRDYNAALKTRIEQRQAAGKRVRFADVAAALTLADLYDGVHPDEAGHAKIAQVWLGVLRSLGSTTPPPPPPPPADGGTAEATLTIQPTQDVKPISPFIYGYNTDNGADLGNTLGMLRLGGNRWTAYNWENNASNAGSDWNHQSDSYLCDSAGCDTPGEAVRRGVASAHAANAGILVTVPILDHVAADKLGNGDVAQTPNYLTTRFRANRPTKGSALSLTPDTTDANVYQDEFVNWLERTFPGARTAPVKTILYSLDNEPDLWPETHPRIHPNHTTYAEMVTRSVASARAIKSVAPGAVVFGPVSYGWNGFQWLQGAPDANGRDFLDFYLQQMRAAEATAGRRLVDVLDLHWYPEATGGGVRISNVNDAQAAAARVQAPRSLWDSSYVETSWITECCSNGGIRLIPRMKEKIAAHYPGTKLAFTEWNYGGGTHISGGIATADVLGIFGRESVYAAAHWSLFDQEPFVTGAFRMFRNYDGAGGRFGDTSVRATTTDIANTSVYASVDAANPAGRIVVVAINKRTTAMTVDVALPQGTTLTRADGWVLSGTTATPRALGALPLGGGSTLRYTMPASSVTTLVLTR